MPEAKGREAPAPDCFHYNKNGSKKKGGEGRKRPETGRQRGIEAGKGRIPEVWKSHSGSTISRSLVMAVLIWSAFENRTSFSGCRPRSTLSRLAVIRRNVSTIHLRLLPTLSPLRPWRRGKLKPRQFPILRSGWRCGKPRWCLRRIGLSGSEWLRRWGWRNLRRGFSGSPEKREKRPISRHLAHRNQKRSHCQQCACRLFPCPFHRHPRFFPEFKPARFPLATRSFPSFPLTKRPADIQHTASTHPKSLRRVQSRHQILRKFPLRITGNL